jgi:hypothetical protein
MLCRCTVRSHDGGNPEDTDAVTQQIFLRYYYDGCPWSVVAKSVGIGVQAAKMRRQRYLETEDERHAV